MSLIIDDDGTITLYQGDSGELIITGLDLSGNYTVYLCIQDRSRNTVGSELQVSASNTDTVTFVLTHEFTDLLVVPKTKMYEEYYYGIKVCNNTTGEEDTLFIGNGDYGNLNKIIVYPRKVKGV